MSRKDKIAGLLEEAKEKVREMMALAIKDEDPGISDVYSAYVNVEYAVFLIKLEGKLEGIRPSRVGNGFRVKELLALTLDGLEEGMKKVRDERWEEALEEVRAARDGLKEAYLLLRKSAKGRTASSSAERSLSPLKGRSS